MTEDLAEKINNFVQSFESLHVFVAETLARYPRLDSDIQSWRERVLPNLAIISKNVSESQGALEANNIKPMVQTCAACGGLGKDLDFSTAWMSEAEKKDFETKLAEVVQWAYQVHKAGFPQT